jgi:hypothetical protein
MGHVPPARRNQGERPVVAPPRLVEKLDAGVYRTSRPDEVMTQP